MAYRWVAGKFCANSAVASVRHLLSVMFCIFPSADRAGAHARTPTADFLHSVLRGRDNAHYALRCVYFQASCQIPAEGNHGG